MTVLDGIRAVGEQRLRTQTSNGETLTLDIRYNTSTRAWFADVIFGSFVLNNVCLIYTLNLLRQYLNIIDFGIAIFSSDGSDPFLINDFATNRVQIGILTPSEVAQVETTFSENREL